MTKPTEWHVCQAKTPISLGFHPVWSESSLYTQWVAKDPSFLHADSEDWSDWADTQADLSLRWVHVLFCWFCHEAAQIVLIENTEKFIMIGIWNLVTESQCENTLR